MTPRRSNRSLAKPSEGGYGMTQDEFERLLDIGFVFAYPCVVAAAIAVYSYTGWDGAISFVTLVSGVFLLPIVWIGCVWNLVKSLYNHFCRDRDND